MTDPTPSNLSPYGEHAPGPEPLSPAAEAIFFAADGMQPRQYRGRALAAAIRALADRMAPEPSDIDKGFFSLAAIRERCRVRDAILAIATELEGCEK